MSEIKDYAGMFTVDKRILDHHYGDAEKFVIHKVQENEKECLWKSISQVPDGNWIVVNKKTDRHENSMTDSYEYRTVVRCRPVVVEKVYVTEWTERSKPKDVFMCRWCNGYTRNDSVGNCAACGAPRTDDWSIE